MIKSFATADLFDINNDLGSCSTAFMSFGQIRRFYGPMVTLSCYGDNALIKATLATKGSGRVLVADGQGYRGSALMGDQIAALAVANHWAGVVIHGVIRDSVAINAMAIGVKALGTNPKKSTKTGSGELGLELDFGGARFIPGHFLYSDEDGIALSPVALGEQ